MSMLRLRERVDLSPCERKVCAGSPSSRALHAVDERSRLADGSLHRAEGALMTGGPREKCATPLAVFGVLGPSIDVDY